MTSSTRTRRFRGLVLSLLLLGPCGWATAQNRFETLPGHDRYEEAQRAFRRASQSGRIREIVWEDDGVRFQLGSETLRYDFATGEIAPFTAPEDEEGAEQERSRRRGPARGRQQSEEPSPDGRWVAVHRSHNLYLKPGEENPDAGEVALTTDGNGTVKYATASWVYGEELRQTTAMWWSPDSSMIAFYEFDESEVRPYYLTPGLTSVQNQLYVEAYPKPGQPNPKAGLLVYHIGSGETVRIDTTSGLEDPEADHYVYNVKWAPDSDSGRHELLYNRTNRHQNVLEIRAADPATGDARTLLTERQETWQNNRPEMRFLDDGRRFIWETERSGWKHFELRTLDGTLLNPLTSGEYPCNSILRVEEESPEGGAGTGWVYFTAFSAENPLHEQLHRVRLDGSAEQRLTSENLNHTSISLAPDQRHFIATTESIDTPPTTSLYSIEGECLAVLAEFDKSILDGRPMPEMFTFKADDGETDLYGVLHKPSNFDPQKKYPLLIEVYGGPLSQSVRARFTPGHAHTEFGFLIAEIDNRGTENRGKAFEGATYLKLGSVDLKDQADGVRYLSQRPYVDGDRVGITGHSYGGYMAALAVMKHPDVFHVAVAGAPVTNWRNYDTIYTERFMRTPQENEEGYDEGACATYVDQFEGKLLLLHGMVDDNVHPTNSWQLIHALQEAKKPFEMMFFPNSGHGIRSPSVTPRKWEFLYDHLIGE